jgi:hypothetical protein
MAVKHILATIAVAAALAGCTRVGKDYTARMQAREQVYVTAAGAPVNSFHYFNLWSWEPLSDNALAVYTSPNEAWTWMADAETWNSPTTSG